MPLRLIEIEPDASSTNTAHKGRPSLKSELSSQCSKRKKTKDIRDSCTSTKLAYATHMNLRTEGMVDAANLCSEIFIKLLQDPQKSKNFVLFKIKLL